MIAWTDLQVNDALKKILGDAAQPVINGFTQPDRKQIVLDLFDSQNSAPPPVPPNPPGP